MKLFYKVINKNEAYLATASDGTQTMFRGPYRISLPFKYSLKPLVSRSADQNQYLTIKYLDGNSINVNGPLVEFINPLDHEDIIVNNNIYVKQHENIRIYNMNQKDNKVSYHDIAGPCNYVPKSYERVIKLITVKANIGEYLKVYYKDGRIDMINGPCSLIEDPDEHQSIHIEKCLIVNSDERLRIYRSDSDNLWTYSDIEGQCYYTPRFNEKTVKLAIKKAILGEYVRIVYKDGKVSVVNGPTAIIDDPDLYAKVNVEKCLVLNSNECIFVYRQNDVAQNTTRIRIDGPCYYTPTPNETYHEFSWHGRDKSKKDSSVIMGSNVKVPNAIQFKILTLIPRQIYVDVPIRTFDDAEIITSFMVFYELNDVELMLATTTDPIGDVLNYHGADVISFVNGKTFDQFKSESINLNNLKYFPQLIKSMKERGYIISNVVFKGYLTNSRLQKIHEDAIATRTSFILETEKEKQTIEDFKLKKKNERIAEENKFLLSELEDKLRRSQLEHDQKIFNERKELELELEKIKKKNEEEVNKYQKLKEMDVDLTRVISENYIS
jgi:hypothetical protein